MEDSLEKRFGKAKPLMTFRPFPKAADSTATRTVGLEPECSVRSLPLDRTGGPAVSPTDERKGNAVSEPLGDPRGGFPLVGVLGRKTAECGEGWFRRGHMPLRP